MVGVRQKDTTKETSQAVGLNFKDALMVLGMYPGAAAAPGTDYAGTVLAAGPNTNVLPGTQVIGFAHGALGTVVLASATTCAPLPPSLNGIKSKEGMTSRRSRNTFRATPCPSLRASRTYTAWMLPAVPWKHG